MGVFCPLNLPGLVSVIGVNVHNTTVLLLRDTENMAGHASCHKYHIYSSLTISTRIMRRPKTNSFSTLYTFTARYLLDPPLEVPVRLRSTVILVLVLFMLSERKILILTCVSLLIVVATVVHCGFGSCFNLGSMS